MEIKINNQIKSFEHHETLTVQQLLDIEMPDKQKGIAVAIGDTVIPKLNWSSTVITPNQDIIIIKATQGG